jgi:hypothetical protein
LKKKGRKRREMHEEEHEEKPEKARCNRVPQLNRRRKSMRKSGGESG